MSVMYLPSGLSVTQAKKDAKKLSKSENIKLSEALDKIALRHGRGTWAEVSHQLDSQHQLSVRLELPDTEAATVYFPKNKSFTTICGQSGSGKTVLGLEFAAQWLSKGNPVIYLGFPGGHARLKKLKEVAPEYASDKIMLALAERFPKTFRVFDDPRFGIDLPSEEIKEKLTSLELNGAILILDEPQMYRSYVKEMQELLNSSMHSVIVAQHPDDIGPFSEGLSDYMLSHETNVWLSPGMVELNAGYIEKRYGIDSAVYDALSKLDSDYKRALRSFVVVKKGDKSKAHEYERITSCQFSLNSHSAFKA